jgi:hypothetical protein
MKLSKSSFQEVISCHKNSIFFRAGHPGMSRLENKEKFFFSKYTKVADKSHKKSFKFILIKHKSKNILVMI